MGGTPSPKVIDIAQLTPEERATVEPLLARLERNPPDLEDIWRLMDEVWDELGCDNRTLDQEKLARFYRHPVWLLNDLFIAQHDISMRHRHAISDWIVARNKEIKTVVDYGGGFGALALLINEKNDQIKIDIFEPFPGSYAQRRIAGRRNIGFVREFDEGYDCLVSVDVLEHLPDPVGVLLEMVRAVRINGYVVVANCFSPVIKCHLPATFHLRYTFDIFARVMGLRFLGSCEGSHAQIYQKVRNSTINSSIRSLEMLSGLAYPFLRFAHALYRILRMRN